MSQEANGAVIAHHAPQKAAPNGATMKMKKASGAKPPAKLARRGNVKFAVQQSYKAVRSAKDKDQRQAAQNRLRELKRLRLQRKEHHESKLLLRAIKAQIKYERRIALRKAASARKLPGIAFFFFFIPFFVFCGQLCLPP